MDRNEQILNLRLAGLSFAEIAREVGVSRQRVQQLLAPPKPIRDQVVERAQGKCQLCGVYVGKSGHVHHGATDRRDGDWYNDPDRLQLFCVSCHRKIHNRAEILNWGKVTVVEEDDRVSIIADDPKDTIHIARTIVLALKGIGLDVSVDLDDETTDILIGVDSKRSGDS